MRWELHFVNDESGCPTWLLGWAQLGVLVACHGARVLEHVSESPVPGDCNVP